MSPMSVINVSSCHVLVEVRGGVNMAEAPSHAPMSWTSLQNMPSIVTSQSPMSWSKAAVEHGGHSFYVDAIGVPRTDVLVKGRGARS